MQRFLCSTLIAAALLATGSAHAQSTDLAGAEALFREAKDLVAAGRVAEACPKFLASFRLDPKPGSAVNLADCYERNGQYASAWARYVEGASLAQRAGQSEREQYARDHAKAVEPKLSRLVLSAAPTPGLEVRRDGTPIELAMLGSAVPVDSGKHPIEARAPGKKAWKTVVEVPAGPGTVKVDIPALEDDAGGTAVGPVGPGTTEVPEALVPFWSTQRKVGLGVGIAGVVGLGAGAAFGAIASSHWSTAKNGHCSGTPLACDPAGLSAISDAKSAATISSALFIPGAILLAGGVVVFATSPRSKSPPTTGLSVSPSPLPGGGALTFRGAL